ncbi:MAG: hypothetical protein ACPGSC_15110, partial [Granulosicoccaceae bacterium]
MGALALLASWGLYRYTDVLEHVPFARALDWCAEKSAGLVRQPWAAGLTGAVMLAALPAAAIGILMGLGAFISWPISVVVVLLCMGPMRLVELPAVGSQAEGLASSLSPQRYHALAARDVVGAIVWAAILGAPGAVFYRAARESAESPVAALADQASLMTHARQLFGCMYWLPARVYAVALVASGSGGRLEQLSKLSSDAA